VGCDFFASLLGCIFLNSRTHSLVLSLCYSIDADYLFDEDGKWERVEERREDTLDFKD
jgi:hypothetical protein